MNFLTQGEKKYYSIYCNKYENGNFTGADVLGEVRRKYFLENRRQKNRITKKMFGKVYRYSYCLESKRPIKWKKMLDGEILEKSREGENFYEILYFNKDKKIFKIDKFNLCHEWLKTYYFSQSYNKGPAMTVMPNSDGETLLVKEFQKNLDTFNNYSLFPFKIKDENKFITALPDVICCTSIGDVLFYKEDDLIKMSCPSNTNNKGDKLMKQKNFSNNKEEKNSYGKVMTSNSNKVFECENLTDKKNGLGICFYKSGKLCYVGNFDSDVKNGLGISFKNDGELIHISKWENNSPMNVCSLFNEQGDMLFTGNLIESKKEGFCMVYSKDKTKILTGRWENDIFTGEGTVFHVSGKIEETGKISTELIKQFI